MVTGITAIFLWLQYNVGEIQRDCSFRQIWFIMDYTNCLVFNETALQSQKNMAHVTGRTYGP